MSIFFYLSSCWKILPNICMFSLLGRRLSWSMEWILWIPFTCFVINYSCLCFCHFSFRCIFLFFCFFPNKSTQPLSASKYNHFDEYTFTELYHNNLNVKASFCPKGNKWELWTCVFTRRWLMSNDTEFYPRKLLEMLKERYIMVNFLKVWCNFRKYFIWRSSQSLRGCYLWGILNFVVCVRIFRQTTAK